MLRFHLQNYQAGCSSCRQHPSVTSSKQYISSQAMSSKSASWSLGNAVSCNRIQTKRSTNRWCDTQSSHAPLLCVKMHRSRA